MMPVHRVLLQCGSAGCALQAEGLVTKEQAIQMVEARHLDQLLHPQFKDPKAYVADVVGQGLAASPGAAVGRVVFSAADAEAWKLRGERVVLVRHETSPEDVGGADTTRRPSECTARGLML
jgi:pyruvate, orthophosphate dikinase